MCKKSYTFLRHFKFHRKLSKLSNLLLGQVSLPSDHPVTEVKGWRCGRSSAAIQNDPRFYHKSPQQIKGEGVETVHISCLYSIVACHKKWALRPIMFCHDEPLCWSSHLWAMASSKHIEAETNEHHFADDIFNCIFLNENVWIPIKISLKFVPKGLINNIPAMVQIMAWRRPGDKPLSEPMMVSLPTHICVARPQWVNRPM